MSELCFECNNWEPDETHTAGYCSLFQKKTAADHGAKCTGWRHLGSFDEPLSKLPHRRPIGTEARVCADIAARQALGVAKYGKTVELNPLTLKQWLQHAYEETLDQAVYLRRAIEEIERKEAKP